MNIGLIGLPRSGKTTVFRALTGATEERASRRNEPHLSTVPTPDPRVDFLTEFNSSKSAVYATVQYVDLPGVPTEQAERQGLPEEHLRRLGQVDALLAVVGAFGESAGSADPIARELDALHTELIFSDLLKVEKRLEKLTRTVSKVKGPEREELQRELTVLERAHEALDKSVALRELELDHAKQLITRGFQFLSEKPILYVLNVGEEEIPLGAQLRERLDQYAKRPRAHSGWICAQVEMEIVAMAGEDRRAFMSDYGIDQPAAERLIQRSYELMDYISFLTSAEQETRAWTVTRGSKAPQAAGVIHSDFERGFIRAEIIAFDELKEFPSHAAAKKAGKVRLEGKDYIVNDGDVINFLFNV
jgi:GTP-binding protein YchF